MAKKWETETKVKKNQTENLRWSPKEKLAVKTAFPDYILLKNTHEKKKFYHIPVQSLRQKLKAQQNLIT